MDIKEFLQLPKDTKIYQIHLKGTTFRVEINKTMSSLIGLDEDKIPIWLISDINKFKHNKGYGGKKYKNPIMYCTDDKICDTKTALISFAIGEEKRIIDRLQRRIIKLDELSKSI